MKAKTTVLQSALLLAAYAGNAHAADLTLYADDDYQGRALNVVIDERSLSVRNFDKRASSVVVEKGAWVLCNGEDYSGECVTLEPGRYPSLQAMGLDNAVTSVRRRDVASLGEFKGAEAIARNASQSSDIELFARDDYGGARHLVDVSQADLAPQLMRNQAESAVIANGKWELCSEPQFQGKCVTLGPGKYASLQMYGLTEGAASVRRAPESPHQ
jgi:hypothetical protein